MLLLLTIAWLAACRPVQAATEKLIQLERTACMGPCPVDEITVYTDGRMEYKGGENAPRQGTYRSRLTAAERKQLIAKFDAANFFAFQDSYVSTKLDYPTKYITYWKGGKSKRIRDYDGAPAALKALEAELIKLIKADRWQQSAMPAR
ncbi:hypothetical protein GCM10011375_06140 [Hymenobacter qilianensis]|uniref:Uncharacterized protein n=1 Tax=Hymenobacter qilianensis TaxID=1385715 RepID=A0ACB5PMI6_9BACT|nr:DUF6438 domain-containing protein [Hymenobacter qilianensis]GGF53387.1 hypothetical protein GCM10011375_06140 [Hymenobacter qilianensis]